MIKVGVVGLGMGRWHLMQYNRLPDVKIIAICDVDEKRLNDAAKEFQVPKLFRDYRKMIKLSELDAVSIALPNFLHMPVTLEFLEAGKDVLVEKPMARTSGEAEKMVRKAKEMKKILMINMNHRWNPEFAALKELINAKKFGEIYYLKARWIRTRTFDEKQKKVVWFANKEKAGGGTLLDIGVHCLDLGLHMLNDFEPVSVFGTVGNKFHQEVDDFASVLIKFKDGKIMHFETTWESHIKKDDFSISILGTKAGADTSPLRTYQKEEGIPTETVYNLPPGEAPADQTSIGHFVECVTKRKEPITSPEKGLRVMRILDAIYRSSRTGKEVRL